MSFQLQVAVRDLAEELLELPAVAYITRSS